MAKSVNMKMIRNFAKAANKELFNGQLNINVVKFSISTRMVNTLGLHKCGGGKPEEIVLSGLLFGAKEEWRTTLIHELVHCWQYQTGKELNHGPSFVMMAKKIAAIDPAIQITRTRSSEYLNKAVAEKRRQRRGY